MKEWLKYDLTPSLSSKEMKVRNCSRSFATSASIILGACFQCLPLIVGTFIFLVLLIVGCEVEYPWKLQSDNTQTLVVDGILTNELKAQIIKLSLVNPGINMPYQPVSGAAISVSDNTHLYIFSESSQEPGSYYSTPFQAVVDKNYVLKIGVQSSIYTASAYMVAITALGQIKIIRDKNLYRYNDVKYGNPAMIEVFYDWSSDTAYCSSYGSCQAQETFYVLNNVDVNKEFGPSKDTIFFPKGTKIIRKKYSLSEEHQDFLRSLLMETEWRGGIVDVQQGNVSTNISNGARGFFGACMVLSDTTVVK
jgi:hypothetical protein